MRYLNILSILFHFANGLFVGYFVYKGFSVSIFEGFLAVFMILLVDISGIYVSRKILKEKK